MADWVAIRNEYITTEISLRALARKHSVSFSTLEKKARAGKWLGERKATSDMVATAARQKSVEAAAQSHADRIALIMSGGTTAARLLCRHLEEMERSGEIRPYEIKATVEALKGVRDLYKADEDRGEDDKLNAYLEGMKHA